MKIKIAGLLGIKGRVEIWVRYTAATMSLLVLHPRIRQTSYQVTSIFYKPWVFLGRSKMFLIKLPSDPFLCREADPKGNPVSNDKFPPIQPS